MPDNDGAVRRIAWKVICPWLILFRVFPIAISGQVLLLAVIGSLAVPAGWRVSEVLFVSQSKDLNKEDESVVNEESQPSEDFVRRVRNERFIKSVNQLRSWPAQAATRAVSLPTRDEIFSAQGPIFEVRDKLAAPVVQAVRGQPYLRRNVYYLFGTLWTLLVWGLLAGMICRLSAARLTQDERLTLPEVFEFTRKRWHSHALAPVFPLVGVLLITLMIAAFSLPLRMGAWYGVVLGVFWIPVLVGGCLMAVLTIGLGFGWPLMWPVIATEETGDVFEATSRSFSYTFQRPFHYLFFVLVAVLIGSFAAYIVDLFATLVIDLSARSATWGGGNTVSELRTGASGWLLGFGNGLVRTVAYSFNHAFFWCSATAIYLLLRQNADHIELDEIYLEDEQSRYDLPNLSPQPGEPQVTEIETPAAENPPAADSSEQSSDDADNAGPTDS